MKARIGIRGATKLHRARLHVQSWQRSVLTAVPASFRDRFAQQQTNEASKPPLHGFSGTRAVGATEEVVHRPARARLPDAEQTRAKPMKPELRIRIFGSGPTIQQGPIV